MRIAILGADDESVALIRWAVREGRHDLVAAYDSNSHTAALRQFAPAVRIDESWEELLLGSAADAVVVGRGGKEAAVQQPIDFAERRADQLRKLVQAAVPMIIVCPACEAIVGFEIEMIRRDTGAVIVPYVPGADHPAILRLEEVVSGGDDSPLGKVEQIALEREQANRNREAVLVQLARDATILRRLIGTIQTVTASGPLASVGRDPLGPKPKELPSLANLAVHFAGEEGLTARWSMAPAIGSDQARLTIIGQSDKAVLTMPANAAWTLHRGGDGLAAESLGPLHVPAELFTRLTHAMTQQRHDDSAWLAACRDQEAAEAVDRSLSRGRTIELFNEEHTEEESFKGVMAMGGCLLLVMALGVLFIAVMVEGLRLPMRSWPLWRLWPFYLLVPIAAFLLLQLLQLVVKRDDSDLRRLMGHGEPGR
jgi:hypothetical protein